jgi:glycosyltransferase involved in cell wall biosynthesis
MIKFQRIILIVPSWYPSGKQPLYGSFIKEQAEAIAKYYPNFLVLVSLRSDVDVILTAKMPFKTLWQFLKGSFQKVIEDKLSPNFIELGSPAFSFLHGLGALSAMKRLLALSNRNLQYAQKKFGAIDIMHAHVSYQAGYVAALLSQKNAIPYVLTEHMSPFPFKNLLIQGHLKPEVVVALTHANKVIAVSNSLADTMAAYKINRPKVIPNMVDEQVYKSMPMPHSGFVFFSLGRLSEQKGFNVLLDAISIWSPDASVKFLIGGTGPLENQLKEKSAILGIDKYIDWLGVVSRENNPSLFNQCDAFVLASFHETFGIVYAEAIASGKPVIATRCGGAEDIVNEKNGILVNKNNPHELAKALEWMFHHAGEYSPSTIRNDFMERFSQAMLTNKLVELYEEVISSN